MPPKKPEIFPAPGPDKPSSPAKMPAFYTEIMSEAEKLDFEQAAGIEGVDAEIALLRMEIRELIASDPEHVYRILAATDILAKLIKTRYSITKEQKKGLKEAFENVIKDVAVPLGIAAIAKKL